MTATLHKLSATAACLLAAICQLSAQIEVTGTGVGIGTSSPAALLHVSKTGVTSSADMVKIAGAYDGGNLGGALTLKAIYHSGYGADYDFGVGQWNGSGFSNISLLNLNSNGNVGIGTTNPVGFGGTNLDIYHSSLGSATLRSGSVTAELLAFNSGFVSIGTRSNHLLNLVTNDTNRVTIDTVGNVGIGTQAPAYKLEVAGSVRATSFISNSTTYADFVFKPGYKLASLAEVEAAIQRDGHLPGIPSEAEAKERGIDLGAMQVKLLQKVEELTLHVIALEKRTRSLEEENARLKTNNNLQP